MASSNDQLVTKVEQQSSMHADSTVETSEAPSGARKSSTWRSAALIPKSDSSAQEDINEIKINAMYRMVEDVVIAHKAKSVCKKVLYLTNKQVGLFNEDNMPRCIDALGIKEHKFVIRLLTSTGWPSQSRQDLVEQYRMTPQYQYQNEWDLHSPEVNASDDRFVQTQLVLFLRTCILPLAKKTKAIILVSGLNQCCMTSALANVIAEEQQRTGEKCPFQVVAWMSEYDIHRKAVEPQYKDSIAAKIASGTSAWRNRISEVHSILMNATNTEEGADLSILDLNNAASHYIIFEEIDELRGEPTWGETKASFEKLFTQCLTKGIPSIGIQCGSCWIDGGLAYHRQMLMRNIPILYIDTTERAITMRKRRGLLKPKTNLAELSDAFPSVSSTLAHRIRAAFNSRGCANGLDLSERLLLFEIARDMEVRKQQALANAGVVDHLEACGVAFFHQALHLGAEVIGNGAATRKSLPLYLRLREMEELERTNKDSGKSRVPHELVSEAITFLQTHRPLLRFKSQLQFVKNWLQDPEKYLPDEEGEERESMVQQVKAMIPDADKFQVDIEAKIRDLEERRGIGKGVAFDQQSWLDLFEVFISPHTYSGSVHDLEGLKNTIASIAKLDSLPTSNSIEALRSLQVAWDDFEVYWLQADRYKFATKLSYFMLLTVAILITAFSLVQSNLGFESRTYIIALSFVETAIAAYFTFSSPALKWQHLRMAALSIESNIWIFRTRTGSYAISGEEFDQSAEENFASFLRETKHSVLEGAEMKKTAFYGRGVAPQNLHGQREPVKDRPRRGRVSPNTDSGRDLEKGGDRVQSPPIASGEGSSGITSPPVDAPQVPHRDEPGGRDGSVSLEDIVAMLRREDSEDAPKEELGPDSHYELVTAEGYIEYRVRTSLAYYKRRIPLCNRTRYAAQVLLVLGSIASGALAFFGVQQWAAMVSIVTSIVNGYLEFSGTAGKISRYSGTVHGLEDLLLWWATLQKIDRQAFANVDRLVTSCEEVLRGEQRGWCSTSQAVKTVQRQASDERSHAE